MLILSYFWFGFVHSVFGISKVEMGFVDCGGRPVKKQRKTKRKKTTKKDTDERCGRERTDGYFGLFGYCNGNIQNALCAFCYITVANH